MKTPKTTIEIDSRELYILIEEMAALIADYRAMMATKRERELEKILDKLQKNLTIDNAPNSC